LPDVKIRWSDVWVGAFITAILFTIGEFAISFYLGRSTAASVFGAELTQVYANRFGSRILPSEHAVAMPEEERVQQGLPHKAARQDAQSGIAHYGRHPSGWTIQPSTFGNSTTSRQMPGSGNTSGRARGAAS